MSITQHGAADRQDGKVHAHPAPLWMLFGVFGSLLVLTVVTVWVSRGPYDFGWLSVFIALIVASAKAMLVMLFFMHLIHDKRFNMLAFFSAYLFLGLFLFFAMVDSAQYQDEIRAQQRSEDPVTAAPVGTPTTMPSPGSTAPTGTATGPAGAAAPTSGS